MGLSISVSSTMLGLYTSPSSLSDGSFEYVNLLQLHSWELQDISSFTVTVKSSLLGSETFQQKLEFYNFNWYHSSKLHTSGSERTVLAI